MYTNFLYQNCFVAESPLPDLLPATMNATRDSHGPVDTLLRRFRTQQPVRGGSLLLTLFGDAIAPRGGRAMLGSLIALAQPFGLSERLVRTAVGRLATEGWLVADRHGRRSQYRLTEAGERLFAEATRRIYRAHSAPWDGRWTLVVLPPSGQQPRRELREELRWLGFGELGPSVFAHPSCTVDDVHSWLAPHGLAANGWAFKTAPEGLEQDQRLATTGWDLTELTRRYRRFCDGFSPVLSVKRGSLPPLSAFLVRTLLIHEFRKVQLRDPHLPLQLLPQPWIGTQAYELSSQIYGSVFAAAEEFLTETTRGVDEALPPPGPAVYERFGGLNAA